MEVEDFIFSYNNSPLDELSGLSPSQTHDLIHSKFGQSTVLKLRSEISDAVLDQIPFFRICEEYLKIIDRVQFIRLTPLGSLQNKVIKELYDSRFIPEKVIESGLYKTPNEDNCRHIAAAKLVCDIARLTRKENSRVMLTKKGKEAIAAKDRKPLFDLIFEIFVTKFNWGYFDLYPQQPIGQYGYLFSIYLILKFGQSFKPVTFYSLRYQKVFPNFIRLFLDEYESGERPFRDCYEYRTFDNFLNWFGLIQFKERVDFYAEKELRISTTVGTQIFLLSL